MYSILLHSFISSYLQSAPSFPHTLPYPHFLRSIAYLPLPPPGWKSPRGRISLCLPCGRRFMNVLVAGNDLFQTVKICSSSRIFSLAHPLPVICLPEMNNPLKYLRSEHRLATFTSLGEFTSPNHALNSLLEVIYTSTALL
jgi:hypothetical protein